ncbi:lithostathine-like [Littorina saxatilis]|uniref:C-type lectin domain-containing protein n=1 Tax=Littorina saxatilis TaxID=31220 RepID=A0AAN9G9L2_9CAEN
MRTRLRHPVLVCCLTLLTEIQCCPGGWTQAGSLCLTYHAERKSWDDAQSACSDMQGHLVKVKDAAENAALVQFRTSQAQRNNPVWLGMLRTTTGSWQWYDGKTVTWASWEGGTEAASMGDSTCGQLTDSGGRNDWSAYPCSVPLSFVCHFTENEPSTPEPTEKSQKWRRLGTKGEYSGKEILMTVASSSRINCVGQCQSTLNCDAVGYHRNTDTCQLITGRVSTNQMTESASWELWLQNQ